MLGSQQLGHNRSYDTNPNTLYSMVLPKFLRLHDCVHVLCTSSLLRAQQFLVRRLRTRLAIVAIQGVLFAAEESPFALLAERNCSYLYRVDLSIFVRAFLF